ncbi:MAG: DUF2671 domain-containing protein [Pseudomonadota bacterium]
MAYQKKSIKKSESLIREVIKKVASVDENMPLNAMNDPSYLCQSSSLINESLKKGFDVLQLANGDIVTTGTKIIVTQYSWDASKSKLMKAKPVAKDYPVEENDIEELSNNKFYIEETEYA